MENYLNTYIEAMLSHLKSLVKQRTVELPPIASIFIGGGTPSLCPPKRLQTLLQGIQTRIHCSTNLEITVECNPETLSLEKLVGYRDIGINRLSIGVQTFCAELLEKLGRLHTPEHTYRILELTRQVGFTNVNVDLMYGLPQQTPEQAYQDLVQALGYDVAHLSWYQLTIEPNTPFGKWAVQTPSDEIILNMESLGKPFIASKGLRQYEISAYSKPAQRCQHNLNYWQFGDYLALGLGAHSKLTCPQRKTIQRLVNSFALGAYLDGKYTTSVEIVRRSDQPLEFFMNQCRLMAPIPKQRFLNYTQSNFEAIEEPIREAVLRGYLIETEAYWKVTPYGFQFLEDLLLLFVLPIQHISNGLTVVSQKPLLP